MIVLFCDRQDRVFLLLLMRYFEIESMVLFCPAVNEQPCGSRCVGVSQAEGSCAGGRQGGVLNAPCFLLFLALSVLFGKHGAAGFLAGFRASPRDHQSIFSFREGKRTFWGRCVMAGRWVKQH